MELLVLYLFSGSRMSSCLNVEINGLPQSLLAGGWNATALADTAVYTEDNQK